MTNALFSRFLSLSKPWYLMALDMDKNVNDDLKFISKFASRNKLFSLAHFAASQRHVEAMRIFPGHGVTPIGYRQKLISTTPDQRYTAQHMESFK
jgi:hypothetical protein